MAVVDTRHLTALLFALALAPPGSHAGDAPGTPAAAPDVEAASVEDPQARRRFEEQVDVVAEGPTAAEAPAELPVRPMAVMAAAGTADNVFRALQTLPGIAGTTEFDSRISVRGGGPDENLTVMDGVEVHNPYRLFGLTSAFNPETVRGFDLYAGAFSAKYGDRLSSLLVVENRPGTDEGRLRGSTALSLTDANAVFEGGLPGKADGSWIVAARRTYYDLVANRLVGTDLPSFGDLQGRADWILRPGTRLVFFGLLSRESTDAFFEGDRPGEQGNFATTARNDLAAVTLTTLLGRRASSRTIASYYVNRDRIGADAQFRAEARRSNAPTDDVGFRLADADFVRELGVRDLALRQELALTSGAHLVETGFEVHRLSTRTVWHIEGDRNLSAANGSSVQGGAGLPSDLDSTVDSTRAGGWLLDRWRASARVSVEAGLRLDWSGVNRRATLSPRVGATVGLGGSTRLRAGAGMFTQSPGYEKLIQSDYFVDLSGDLGRSLRHERAAHAVLGLERDLARGVSARVEGYWKRFDDLVVGRLETEDERLARLGRYDFPAELAASIPADPIITSFPANGASGRSWGFDVLVQKRPAPGGRLAGWASYTWGRATRDEYGLAKPFEYDRRHAATFVATWRFSPRWALGTTVRAFSGFPRTPVLGLRVAADESVGGRLVPALDEEGRYVYETDSGGVENLGSARLPAFFRLDLRLTWKPRGDAGRWLFYLDVINATNRDNVGQVDSARARPRLRPRPAAPRPRAVRGHPLPALVRRTIPLLSDLPPFTPFGPAHLGALVSVVALAVSLVALVRARPALGRPVRLSLAAGIVVLVAFEFSVGLREGWLGWRVFLPLELCDAALVLSVIALAAPRRATSEVVYFWAVSGTVLAMLTPELAWGFPRWEFLVFFGLHGLVLCAAVVLVFGLGLRPRPGAALRVWGITAAWAAVVGLVDLVFDANYMYLRHKPLAETPLDWMGPWPVYIVVGAGVALGLFLLLGLPFRRERPADGGGA